MKTPMALWLAAWAMAGCGEDRGHAAPAAGETRAPAPGGAVTPPVPMSLPRTLTCVSGAVRDERTLDLRVLRVTIAHGEPGKAGLTVEDGPQFRVHGDRAGTPSPAVSHAATWSDDGAMRAYADGTGLRVGIRRDGVVLRGTFEDADALARDFTCWNETELFGSPWTSTGGSLTAHYDRELHGCVDGLGAAALNPLPVEVVRETGRGECADLRGVSLNGEDLSYPALQGWDLAGARLDGARLFFADLDDALLLGADLAGLSWGYATLTGSTDENTQLPNGDACQRTSSPWSGETVSCQQ